MYYIGIDLGGTRIKIGLIKKQELLDKQIVSARSKEGISSQLNLIDEVIEVLVKKYEIQKINGIAMAFPGIVDPFAKKVLSTNKKYDDAVFVDLEAYFREKWKTPFFIDNDARMAAVAEWKLGAGKGYDDLVMVTLGTGVGTSVVMQGKLMRGKHFQAGCLGGHFVVNVKGNQCTCGNEGCVEAEASAWSMEAFTKKISDCPAGDLPSRGIDFKEIFKAASKGDKKAKEIRNHCFEIWSAGIISYIHAYDPEIVIIGGGILNSADEIIPYIQEKVNKLAWTPWGKVVVKKAAFQDFGGVIGGVLNFQENF